MLKHAQAHCKRSTRPSTETYLQRVPLLHGGPIHTQAPLNAHQVRLPALLQRELLLEAGVHFGHEDVGVLMDGDDARPGVLLCGRPLVAGQQLLQLVVPDLLARELPGAVVGRIAARVRLDPDLEEAQPGGRESIRVRVRSSLERILVTDCIIENLARNTLKEGSQYVAGRCKIEGHDSW